MDIANEFMSEIASAVFQSKIQINGQECDLLKLLSDLAENQEKILTISENTNQTANEMNSKLDVILEKIDALEQYFYDLKQEDRDIEEKLTLMNVKLSKLDVKNTDLDEYYCLAQEAYMKWESLDPLTQQFIPLAEYLYSKLQKYDKPDYSPVVLELCRAIENELLVKVFCSYTNDLLSRKADKLDEFLAEDRASVDLKDKTQPFVKAVSKAKDSGRSKYTLGQMKTILSMSKSKKTIAKSPLLKDFVDFLETNTDAKALLDDEYIKKIDIIINDYRNPSAHPEFMSVEKAKECREIMPDRIDYLMDCLAI